MALLMASCVYGSAVFVASETDSITVTDADLLDIPDDLWALAFWVKTGDNAGTGLVRIVDWDDTVGARYLIIRLGQDTHATLPGDINWLAKDNDGSTITQNTTNGINDDAWHHVVIMRIASFKLSLTIDGVVDANSASSGFDAVAPAIDLTFGFDVSASNGYFDGKLAEVAFWTGENLSDAEIDKLSGTGGYSATAPNALGNNPVWYLPLYEDDDADIGALTTANVGITFDTADHPVSYGSILPELIHNRRIRSANHVEDDLRYIAERGGVALGGHD